MAANLETCKSTGHLRSTSLPSSSHPLTTSVEEQLVHLRSSEATPSASLISQKLGGLKHLYDRVEDWLQLPLTQETLSKQNHGRGTDDLLERSLRSLDICGVLREVLSLTKERLGDLESSLRRKSCVDSTSAEDIIDCYLTSRKKTRKIISQTCKTLKKMNPRHVVNQVSPEEATLNLLTGVDMASISVFESLACFLSRPRDRSNRWNSVKKVLSSKQVLCEDAGEVDQLDIELLALRSGCRDINAQLHDLQKKVEALESSISEMEEVSGSIFSGLLRETSPRNQI
ncbi:hypothetical protein SAY86_015467 [Trapa natans]|uniref:Uncharacterized protein n=1 Tax=Trapa natans TaxID=22666 RepID=A0AAN7LAH6_TRANT|nr:hypothetical protein SAY86_015467 [Trapa natans]